MLQLQEVVRSRDVLNAFAFFPDVWGGKYRHTPVLTVQVPDKADVVKVYASVVVQSKDPPTSEHLYDERTFQPSGCFVNAQLRASEEPPDVVVGSNPNGILIGVYSGENVGNQGGSGGIRPYWQLSRQGWLLEGERPGIKWIALYVAPASGAIKYPQHLWVASSEAYAVMEMEIYKSL